MDASDLRTLFLRRFGSEATHQARAPGRVDLLGEGLAPHGLPLLSVALSREVRIALRPRDDGVVRVVDAGAQGGEVSFEVGVGAEADARAGAVAVLAEVARLLARRFAVWRGFDALLSVDVPHGLGREPALRLAGALALAEVGEVGVGPSELAELLGGGREGPGFLALAAALEARRGYAVALSAEPFRIRPLLLPGDWRVVVARVGPEGVEPPPWREQRRTECREALEILGRRLEEEGRTPAPPPSWGALFRAYGGAEQALQAGEAVLRGALLKRFRHLGSETVRVREGEDALLMADLLGLGTLMDASHGSLRGDFLASSTALDAGAAAALEGGAAGAHLSGWGGWIVTLADVGTVEGVLEALSEEGGGRSAAAREAFVTEPSAGASFGPLG